MLTVQMLCYLYSMQCYLVQLAMLRYVENNVKFSPIVLARQYYPVPHLLLLFIQDASTLIFLYKVLQTVQNAIHSTKVVQLLTYIHTNVSTDVTRLNRGSGEYDYKGKNWGNKKTKEALVELGQAQVNLKLEIIWVVFFTNCLNDESWWSVKQMKA